MTINKKGFTLVELLAVVVILAIILVIAVPSILNIITDARNDAYERQVELIIDAAKKYVASYTSEIVWDEVEAGKFTTTVYLSKLQQKDILPSTMEDPRNNSNFVSEEVYILITRVDNNYTYEFKSNADSGGIVADNSGASLPNLRPNMIPIMWDGTNWVVADLSNRGTYAWYDYDLKRWANAVTVTEVSRSIYQNADSGTIVDMSDILTFLVWIPRYKYAIPDGTGAREIDIVFESSMEPKSTGTAIGADYYTHPAFTFGVDELEGLWVGKFEMTGTISDLTIKPNLVPVTLQNVSSMFNATRAMQSEGNQYGFETSGIDTHMMKNSEWGAVAYLSHSKYGKNAEIWINNSSPDTTGCAGSSASASTYSGCEYAYDTANGQQASTTGNIYGVYDMSGGSFECMMANYNNTVANSGFISFPDSKYYDRYTTTNYATACNGIVCKGHALSETKGWYDDSAAFVYSTFPWLRHGGSSETTEGALQFSNVAGQAFTYGSFRFVIN